MHCTSSLLSSLSSNFASFGAIVWRCRFFEPWMLKRLLGGNPFRRIINKDLPQEVKEISAKLVVFWYDFIQPLHSLDKPSRCSSCFLLWVIKFQSFEELCCWISSISFGHAIDLLDKMTVKSAATNTFHHCQVLQIVMCLKKRISCEELDKNAPNAPNITWE